MTTLAKTADYLVEYESNMLTIARCSDGHCLALTGRGIAGEFRSCLKTHAPDRVIATFMRMIPNAVWKPLYKPNRMER